MFVTVEKDGQRGDVPEVDLASWQERGWSYVGDVVPVANQEPEPERAVVDGMIMHDAPVDPLRDDVRSKSLEPAPEAIVSEAEEPAADTAGAVIETADASGDHATNEPAPDKPGKFSRR